MDTAELITSYIESGIAVFPLHGVRNGHCTCGRTCPSPAKHPLLGLAHRADDPRRATCKGECGQLGHGLYDATTDPGQVSEWLGQYPECNWGGRPPLGVLVLDVDPRNDGHIHLAELERKNGLLPTTLTAQTGSGGLHHWFSYSGPTRGKLCPGVDVKTNTGYVVLPPSRHISGGTYFWLVNEPAAYATDWVKAIMNPPRDLRRVARTGSGDGKGLIAKVAASVVGEINDVLYWAACRAAEQGILDQIEDDLMAAAEHAAGSQATASGAAQSRRTIGSARRRPNTRKVAV